MDVVSACASDTSLLSVSLLGLIPHHIPSQVTKVVGVVIVPVYMLLMRLLSYMCAFGQ